MHIVFAKCGDFKFGQKQGAPRPELRRALNLGILCHGEINPLEAIEEHSVVQPVRASPTDPHQELVGGEEVLGRGLLCCRVSEPALANLHLHLSLLHPSHPLSPHLAPQ